MENSNEHLIVTIVNKGYSEKVMTEAKKAGATGGTTISGRGFGENDVVKFLKISIEAEKDIASPSAYVSKVFQCFISHITSLPSKVNSRSLYLTTV